MVAKAAIAKETRSLKLKYGADVLPVAVFRSSLKLRRDVEERDYTISDGTAAKFTEVNIASWLYCYR
jgi:hypothetical protein